MGLGAAQIDREARPLGADAGKMQAGGVDEEDLRLTARVAMPSMCWNSPENTSGLRMRLASARVERCGTCPPT